MLRLFFLRVIIVEEVEAVKCCILGKKGDFSRRLLYGILPAILKKKNDPPQSAPPPSKKEKRKRKNDTTHLWSFILRTPRNARNIDFYAQTHAHK